MDQSKKDSLKVQALTGRIAQLVAQYEEQLADFRAEATDVVETLQAQVQDAYQRIHELEADGEVSEEEGPDSTADDEG